MPKAKEAAREALAIDNTATEAHQALAFVLQYDEWDWPGADREYRRAIELNPGDTIGRSHYATLLVSCCGRADAALAEVRQAIDLDPLSEFGAFSLGLVLNCARQFNAASDQARQMLELHPAYPLAYWNLGVATAAQGKYQEAVTVFRQGLTHAPGDSHLEAYLALASALAGQKEEAVKIISALQVRRQQEYFGGFLLAIANVGLGEHDQAMDWLSAAYEDRDCLLSYLNTWWVFDPLRPDPRFQDLLRRMNFPQL